MLRSGPAARRGLTLRPFSFTIRRDGRVPAARGGRLGGRRGGPRPVRAVHRGRDRPRGAHARPAGPPRDPDARDRARACCLELPARRRPGRPRCGSRSWRADRVRLSLHADGHAAAAGPGLGPPLRGASGRTRACATTPALTRPGATSSSAPTAATPGPTAPPRCSPRAACPRATAPPCRGCCRAGGTGSGAAPTPTARASTSPASGSRSRPGRTPGRSCSTSSAPARRRPTLRALCRLTGFPMQLPEWGYGFWKSRDVHEHQDDVIDDYEGFRRNAIPLDAIVIDSPWATQYNTWGFNPHQFPDAHGMISRMRADGVRTVVWVTPWVNLDSRDGQIPPQPASERLHAQPAPNYAPAAAAGHFVTEPDGEPFVTKWWMGTGSVVDFTSPAAEAWWRESAKRVLELGVEGIKADDGDGYYIPDRVTLADGRTGAEAAWALGGLHRECLQRALDEVHPGEGVLFGRSGWTGQHATGLTWGGDQVSDFWSLRVLVVVGAQRRLQRDLQLLPRRRRLPGAPARGALPAGAARPLAAVRLLHAADARPRADAPGAVELRRPGARPVPRLRAAARATRALHPRRRAHRGPHRGADHAPAVPDRSRRPPRLERSPTPTASAPRCGWRPCSSRGCASARSRCPRGEWVETWSGRDGPRRRGRGRLRADRAHPGVGAGRLDHRHLSGGARRGAGWATRRSPSGRCRPRCGGRRRSATPRRAWPTGARSAGERGRWELPEGRDVTVFTR